VPAQLAFVQYHHLVMMGIHDADEGITVSDWSNAVLRLEPATADRERDSTTSDRAES
jgi:hypothetical protein